MNFIRETKLKIAPVIAFLGVSMAPKPADCRAQAEIDPDHYENPADSSTPMVQNRTKPKRDQRSFQARTTHRILQEQSSASAVIMWNNMAIEAARDNDSGALVMVRALAIMHTAMFDAWTQYDGAPRPTLGNPLRRPENERTIENKREAISYASYKMLADIFPSDDAKFHQLMMRLGYDPEIQSQDLSTSAGVGLRAGSEVLNYRHRDGWATFTEAADESGMSRRYGGVHFEDADIEGRLLGRRVAALSWVCPGTEIALQPMLRAQKETDTARW